MVSDVRFKSNGLDAIEIQDNGNGIAPEDFETIGRHRESVAMNAMRGILIIAQH